ncbi:hypothetical protein GGH99_007300, partial [Coemansia sp. RSA 1285]
VLHQHLHSYYAQETPGQPADTTDTIDVSSASGIGSNSRSEKQVPQHQKQTNPSSIITDQSVSKDASMDSSNSSKGTETRTRRKRTDSISSSSSSDTTTSDSSSTSSSSTTTGSESTGNSSGANHAEEDATSCKICGESICSNTEHICFEHGSVSSDDSPETMPLDRLSVSGTPSRRIASITIPEILQLEDASPSNARPGHLIAYKSLEIASNVTPVVSNYKVAEIIGADKTGLLSVRVLREFRHDKDTGSSVGSAARQRRADLLTSNQTDPNTEPGSNDDDLVVLDPIASTRQLRREKRKRIPVEETAAAALPSTPKRKANKENDENHAENTAPVERRKIQEQLAIDAVATTSKAAAANTTVNPTPCKNRTSKFGAVHSYGIPETERDKEAKAYAKYVLENHTYHNVAEVPRIAASGIGASQTTETTIGLIAESMERLMAGRPLPRNSGLTRKLLMPYVAGLVKWRDVGPSVKSEKPLYNYFANFALFVAQCLQLIAVDGNGNTLDIARLVLI